MIIDLKNLSPGQAYYHMIQSLVPRPIAWALTDNGSGTYNLAPFSYFNTVCNDPPIIMISLSNKADGSAKDTLRNISLRKYFSVHIADLPLLQALNASAASLAADVSELDGLDLTTVEFDGAPVPRIAQCKIAFACELLTIHEIGNMPQSVIYAEVKKLFIDDSITSVSDKGRIKVHTDRLQPIARLGANEYMKAGEVIQLKRPD